ncbi:hypothetical protein [Hymenobacter sp. DG25A]|uniref:hypothetical protein n=1 Tax=Hymenobacter sp. DG25A TaxID=1385663 RepID=UPI0006BDAB97|nr:hypothetical protein [Hymenobacter sp. DG25A]ALD20621.1 hypothetical protein AM218_04500 [Hymenobacter sp. DG25A]
MSYKAPVFWKLFFGMLFTIILCFSTLYRNQKQKVDFLHLTSRLTYISNSLPIQGHLKLDDEPVRYLKIEAYPKYFKLFVGEDIDGSKPNFQQVDRLKTGDIITIYYDENLLSSDKNVSRLAYFIDKDGKPYFIRGKQNTMGYYLIGICLSVIAISYLLKKAGRIA